MKKHLKLLSLAAALCGAVACSSSGGDTTTTGGPGNTGSSSGGVTGTAAGGSPTGSGPTGTASGGSPTGTASGGAPTGTGGNGTSGGTTGGTTGGVQPTTYPCVDGGNAYQPTNPPAGVASCWCNPGIGIADASDAGAQIVASCPQHGAMPDNNIPQPPPGGNESLPLWTSGPFPQPAP